MIEDAILTSVFFLYFLFRLASTVARDLKTNALYWREFQWIKYVKHNWRTYPIQSGRVPVPPPNEIRGRSWIKNTVTQKRPVPTYRRIIFHQRKISWQSRESNPRPLVQSGNDVTTVIRCFKALKYIINLRLAYKHKAEYRRLP